MDRKRLIFWTTFLGGAGAVAILPDFIKPAPVPEVAVAVVARQPKAARAAPELHPAPLAQLRGAAAAPETVAVASIAAASPTSAASAPAELFAAKSWYRP